MPTVDLSGAADLHCHFGPDARRARSVNALEAASDAAAAGHAAVVLKSHDYPTAALASVVDGVSVHGGICCDREVGGVNPAAVETALLLGARVVWLPTLSSRQDQRNGVGTKLGIPGPGLVVADEDTGELLDGTYQVAELVERHGAIMATGHISALEHFLVAETFARRAKVLVTHAQEELAGPNLEVEQCIELADLGAIIELCAMTCIGSLASRSVHDMATCAKAVGVERCTLATDYGQATNARPAAGFQAFADALLAAGLTEDEIRTMACRNPLALLDPSSGPLAQG
jgi:Family of unknown function (DUF6282)